MHLFMLFKICVACLVLNVLGGKMVCSFFIDILLRLSVDA